MLAHSIAVTKGHNTIRPPTSRRMSNPQPMFCSSRVLSGVIRLSAPRHGSPRNGRHRHRHRTWRGRDNDRMSRLRRIDGPYRWRNDDVPIVVVITAVVPRIFKSGARINVAASLAGARTAGHREQKDDGRELDRRTNTFHLPPPSPGTPLHSISPMTAPVGSDTTA